VNSFFAGIGGFDLAFERAGFEIGFQCEIDEFCLDILEKHWPDVPRVRDIRSITNETAIVPADVWVGGFPCQDLSLARMGKRKGLGGSRSGLFYEFARLAGKTRPKVLVIENVHGLLNSHEGRDFQVLISALAKLGYAVGWRTLNSRYFGVPQSRRRVFIVGCDRDWRGPASLLFEPERRGGDAKEGEPNETATVSPFKEIVGDPCGEGPVHQALAYCLYACSARHTGTDWSRTYVCYPKSGRVRRLTARECEGVMGFPDGWTLPGRLRLPERDLEAKRYYALGNAVTPPVAEWLARQVRQYLRTLALPRNP